jgi:hypothetical protein
MRRVQVDLNRRNAAGQTPAKYSGPCPATGERVVAFEPEDGVRASAVVVAVDPVRSIVILDVDWSSIRDDILEFTSASTGGLSTSHTSHTGNFSGTAGYFAVPVGLPVAV